MSADRPRNLLIYVNPYGGNKSAEAIYSRQVSPLLQEMGVTHQAVVTDRPGHAKHHVLEEADLASVDGLVCVGGDGTYAEVCNWLKRFFGLQLSAQRPFYETCHAILTNAWQS